MLELKNLTFAISQGRTKQTILNEISLRINRGDFVVITGPNGSGKSTLAQVIAGIKTPTTGNIILNHEDITHATITERARRGIAFSFQQPVTFKGLCVYDLLNIASGELISEVTAGQYLKKVGLEPSEYLLREVSDKLSGGELKRIEIASVLARKSDLTIFDEPEAGIDLWSFEKLTQIFRQLKRQGQTIIIISHQERILKIADRIIVLKQGKIAASGTPQAILPLVTGVKHGT